MFQRRVIRSLQTASSQSQGLRTSRSASTSFPVTRLATASRSQQLQGRRWYSEAAEAVKKDEGVKEEVKEDVKEEDPVQKELEAKKKEVIDVTDRLKRSIADYRNLQLQTKREVQAAKDFALQRFAKDLIDSIDNLDRALIAVPTEKLTTENQDLVNLHSGLKMTEEILMTTLKKHGMERFDPSDAKEKFDPNKHEATFMVAQPDKEDGTVFHTQQKGFALNGRVLRAAKVGVVKNS